MFDLITSTNQSTRFDRQKETRNALECIHGGKFGALLGAQDFLQTGCDHYLMNRLISGYKKGKFMQEKLNNK